LKLLPPAVAGLKSLGALTTGLAPVAKRCRSLPRAENKMSTESNLYSLFTIKAD